MGSEPCYMKSGSEWSLKSSISACGQDGNIDERGKKLGERGRNTET